MKNENNTTDNDIRYVQCDSLKSDIKPYTVECEGIDDMWTKTCTCDVSLTVGNDVEGDLYFFDNSSAANPELTVGKDEEDLIPNDNSVVDRRYFPNSWSSFCEAYPVTFDEVTINENFKIAAATKGPDITERRTSRLHRLHFPNIDTAYAFISLSKLITIVEKCVTTPKAERRFAVVPKNKRRLVSSTRDENVDFEVIENMSFITYEPHVLMFDNRDQAVEFIEKFRPILIAADKANLIN